MVTHQSVQRHTGLTHQFNFLTLGYTGAQNFKKIKGGLDRYGTEHFDRPIFATVRKKVWD